jgi:hypothetical protein
MSRRPNGVRLLGVLLVGGLALAGLFVLLGRPRAAWAVLVVDPATPP